MDEFKPFQNSITESIMTKATGQQLQAMQERIERSKRNLVTPPDPKAKPYKGRVKHEDLQMEVYKQRNSHKEDDLQTLIINHVRTYYPQFIIFHVGNGGKRNKLEAVRLKRQGVLSGVSDLILLANGNVYFIEVKIKGNTLSQHQKNFQKNVEKQGFQYFVVYSVSDVEDILSKIINKTI